MIKIDTENNLVIVETKDGDKSYSISSPEAFDIISDLWIRTGWDNKYTYSFTWMGRPLIQLPDDMLRLQEVIYSIKPDVIVETGIAHGGSAIFYASLCKAMEKGRVVSVDIEIREHNRKAIEAHILKPYITMFEGSSTDINIVNQVKNEIKENETVLIFLDSNHTKEHVLKELELYSSLVSKNSYIVAMDGIMENVVGAPRTQPDWTWNNPKQAAIEFVKNNPDFEIVEPEFEFNEGTVKNRVTYWPSAFIKKIN